MHLLIQLSLFVMPLWWLELPPSPVSNWRLASEHQEARAYCDKPAAEQAAILRKAQKEKYSVRRIEFIGNAKTNDGTLRRRIMLQEGNIFARALLIKSFKNVNKLRTIYPVRLSDVRAHLNEQERTLDLAICFREKK